MFAKVGYGGYGPTYRATYNILRQKLKSSARLPCVVLQRCTCVDIHRSGERVSSGPAKGATHNKIILYGECTTGGPF